MSTYKSNKGYKSDNIYCVNTRKIRYLDTHVTSNKKILAKGLYINDPIYSAYRVSNTSLNYKKYLLYIQEMFMYPSEDTPVSTYIWARTPIHPSCSSYSAVTLETLKNQYVLSDLKNRTLDGGLKVRMYDEFITSQLTVISLPLKLLPQRYRKRSSGQMFQSIRTVKS